MDYVPWPDSGCGLTETRDRICGSFFGCFESQGHDRSAVAAGDLVESVLSNRRLFAFGHEGRADAPPRLMDFGSSPITHIDWQESKIFSPRATYFDVRIYPILVTPACVPGILPAPFSEVFKTYLLGDPEVEVLAQRGMEKSPAHRIIFVGGRCTIHGIEEWAVTFEHAPLIGEVHPDPNKQSIFDSRNPDCIEIYLASRALKHRYAALISALRRGDIEAEGLPINPNFPTKIPRSVWSHEGFHVDAAGDVYEEIDDSSVKHDFGLVKRWTSLMLNWSHTYLGQSVRSRGSGMFHDEPPTHDDVPRIPIKHGDPTESDYPQTATQISIAEAHGALFADGSDKAIPVKVRDERIIAWQKEHGKKIASPKSISRYLKTRRPVRG